MEMFWFAGKMEFCCGWIITCSANSCFSAWHSRLQEELGWVFRTLYQLKIILILHLNLFQNRKKKNKWFCIWRLDLWPASWYGVAWFYHSFCIPYCAYSNHKMVKSTPVDELSEFFCQNFLLTRVSNLAQSVLTLVKKGTKKSCSWNANGNYFGITHFLLLS